MSEYEDELYQPNQTFEYVVPVKFHNSNKPYSFGTHNPDIQVGDWVVVETIQGVELGECQGASLSTEKFTPRTPLRPILRVADPQDLQDYEDNFEHAKEAMRICQEEIEDLQLGMHLLNASYVLDRSKVLFIYTAEQRVDFRELLKRLGSRLHCRIELRQIGDRDHAKMVGGIGACGMECCCSRFKTHFDNISINMAKTQQLALNIEKLSGMCGKLMCCLKYENEVYEELIEGLPKLGAHVEYEGDFYRVTSINVIANEARIENPESYQTITIDELREKAEVRKGITIKKSTDGARPKRVTAQTPKTPDMVDTTHVGISVLSKIKTEAKELPSQPQQKERVERKEQKQNAPEQNKKQNKQPRHNNRNNNRRREEKPTNNPNVTVRSFKAKKED